MPSVVAATGRRRLPSRSPSRTLRLPLNHPLRPKLTIVEHILARRLETLVAVMLLSALLLLQFQFSMEHSAAASANEGHTSTSNTWKGGATPTESSKCQTDHEKNLPDCQMNRAQVFCIVPRILDPHHDDRALEISFPCEGEHYDEFADALQKFADSTATHGETWGRRTFGVPSDKVILFLGNSDTQQVGQALACQHAGSKHIAAVHAPMPGKTANKITLSNNATLIILTDDKVVSAIASSAASPLALRAILHQETGVTVEGIDGMIWGLASDCGAVAANCPNTTQPAYDAISRIFDGPMLFVGMMADARSDQALAIRDAIRNYRNGGRRNMWFISGRRYISQMKLEGATIYGNGVDADNVPKTGRHGHRCSGRAGGHADLLAFDVTEFLYHQLFYMSGKMS